MIAGIRAVDHLTTMSVSANVPGVPESPSLRLEMHTWLAGPEDLNGIPALRQYAASAQRAMNISGVEEAAERLFQQVPGAADKLRAVHGRSRQRCGQSHAEDHRRRSTTLKATRTPRFPQSQSRWRRSRATRSMTRFLRCRRISSLSIAAANLIKAVRSLCHRRRRCVRTSSPVRRSAGQVTSPVPGCDLQARPGV